MKAKLIPCRMEIISKATPHNCVAAILRHGDAVREGDRPRNVEGEVAVLVDLRLLLLLATARTCLLNVVIMMNKNA